ncbi:MAG TPA: hypothetical protein VJM46_02365 [Candidatus Saccharimonadales bacterium]|nr:hypothetical protein [Candidatus Saccharimonadales bacterium]
MKEVSYILVPGLGDQKPLFGWFYDGVGKWWTGKGMPSKVFDPLWVSSEPYQEKYARLSRLVQQEQQAGRGVVLVGVSAGDTLALLATVKLPVPPIALISLCGFVRLKESDRHDSPYADLSWYRAGEAAERTLADLDAQRRANTLCLIPRVDRVVEPERQRIEGATLKRMNVGGHLWGIVVGLIWHRRDIRQFVNERV